MTLDSCTETLSLLIGEYILRAPAFAGDELLAAKLGKATADLKIVLIQHQMGR